MKNNIAYYYNLQIDKIYQNKDYYYFTINNEKYELVIYTRDLKEQKEIYELNRKMINSNIMVHEIIPNKDKFIVTIINNIPYILYKVYINKEKKITLQELTYLSNYNFEYSDILKRNNWDILWSKKIDYLEYQINQTGKKYPILVDSFSYFVGLAENAISYVKNTTLEAQKEQIDNEVISHRKIHKEDTIYSIYNPLNIIIDHKSRDVSEYIKLSFLNNNQNIYQELDTYFQNNYLSYYGTRLLFARIIYPSFYFDLYEQIILNIKPESEILNITTRTKEYEKYIKNIYYYLKKYYNIPEIEWIIENKDI